MKERTVDIVTAIIIAGFSLVMQSQLDGIPTEGVLFPMSVLWLLLICSLLMAVRAVFMAAGSYSFFDGIPPLRWLILVLIFAGQVLGAMYISFKIFMVLGMFAALTAMGPSKTGRTLVSNLAFAVLFVLFFQVFFTNIMHIYFPEAIFE